MENNNTFDNKVQHHVVEVRPEVLECDVVRFQNNKEKWVAFIGLLNNRPYEIFTGLQDDEEGIVLPKNVNSGKIIKCVNSDGTKRYDFQFENKSPLRSISQRVNGSTLSGSATMPAENPNSRTPLWTY